MLISWDELSHLSVPTSRNPFLTSETDSRAYNAARNITCYIQKSIKLICVVSSCTTLVGPGDSTLPASKRWPANVLDCVSKMPATRSTRPTWTRRDIWLTVSNTLFSCRIQTSQVQVVWDSVPKFEYQWKKEGSWSYIWIRTLVEIYLHAFVS